MLPDAPFGSNIVGGTSIDNEVDIGEPKWNMRVFWELCLRRLHTDAATAAYVVITATVLKWLCGFTRNRQEGVL